MPRSSPPTRRVADVLATVIEQPGRGLSLAEIATRTGISKATCLGIVNELAGRGWLARDDARAYRPGPAMLGAGLAAEQGFAGVHLARPHLERLSAELGATCTASAVVDGQIAVLARVEAGDRVAPAIEVGRRYPFAPPSGVMFVAWDDDETVEAWLARQPLDRGSAGPARLRSIVASCRTRGYLVEGLSDVNTALYSLIAELGGGDAAGHLGELIRRTLASAGGAPYLIRELAARRPYDVSLLCAPAFNAEARMAFLLAVLLMRTGVTGREIHRHAAALTRTAATVTAELGGRDPWPRRPVPSRR